MSVIKYKCLYCGQIFNKTKKHKKGCKNGKGKPRKFAPVIVDDESETQETPKEAPQPVLNDKIEELLSRIPKSEQERVYKDYYNEMTPVPYYADGFVGFIENYEAIAKITPLDWTIVDFGAATNVQSYYFTEHARYIAVEPHTMDGKARPMFQPANCEIFRMTAQQFVSKVLPRLNLDLASTICIVNYVPSVQVNEVARSTFPNLYCFYPKTAKIWDV